MTETEREAGLRDMKEHVCAGVTAMDCGDIYTGECAREQGCILSRVAYCVGEASLGC